MNENRNQGQLVPDSSFDLGSYDVALVVYPRAAITTLDGQPRLSDERNKDRTIVQSCSDGIGVRLTWVIRMSVKEYGSLAVPTR
jgi:hypothetical protein